MPAFKDITGQKFARLTAAWPVGRKHGYICWLFFCDCGTSLIAYAYSVVSGNTKSCGCLKIEVSRKHGRATIPVGTYGSWRSMKQRCENPKNKRYPGWGGRGIKVCERWSTSFVNFLADMGERPPGKTIDRYPDLNGNYEPGNCRWATPKEQQNNMRKRRILTHCAKGHPLKRRKTGVRRNQYCYACQRARQQAQKDKTK